MRASTAWLVVRQSVTFSACAGLLAAGLLCSAPASAQAASSAKDRIETAKALLKISAQLVDAESALNQLRSGKEGTNEFGYIEELISVAKQASDWAGFVSDLMILKSVMRDRADAEDVERSLRGNVTLLNKQCDLWIRQVNESLSVMKTPAAIARGEYIRERVRELQKLTVK